MRLRDRLTAVVDLIADEAEHNDGFRRRLEEVLECEPDPPAATVLCRSDTADAEAKADPDRQRKGGRRTPALFDPVEVARMGEGELRQRLATLSLEQLRDIVAQYGMDPGKLVMKWRDSNRVLDRIVELALARSRKGDAFRAD